MRCRSPGRSPRRSRPRTRRASSTDLKPANVKVRDDGTVKVLDFGLAKALETGPTGALVTPTITSPAVTMGGVILGTAAYMAPEQAKAKTVDRRADIWAFGCVLYEMLTGQRAFKGDDVTDTITAVLRDEPDWTALPAETPVHIRTLLRRCLQKDPRQRLRDIGDARLMLQDAGDQPVTAASTPGRATRAPIAVWAAASLVLGVLSFAAARLTAPASPPPAEVRFEIPTPTAHANWFAISPDGRRLAFVADGQLAIRDMDAIEVRALPGTEGATNPAWSPSGRSIAYTRAPDNRLMLVTDGTRVAFHRMEAGGGDVWMLDLADAVQRRVTFDRSQENASPVWSPDGTRLAFRSRRGAGWALVEKSADGAGAETTLAEFPHVVSPMSWSPDGSHLLFMMVDPDTNWDIWQYSFADRAATPLVNGPLAEGFPQFSPDGRWFAYNANTATAQQLFIESFPRGRGKWQVPSERGQYLRWRADGRELYFLRPMATARSEVNSVVRTGSDTWEAMTVEVRTAGDGLEFGPPRRLFEASGVFGGIAGYSGNYIAWAVSGDGQRFVLQQGVAERPAGGLAPLVVIMHHPALRSRE